MLCELKVENLALIERLHLSLSDRRGDALVVMTGETGAGKSIMMRALGLLTGVRASSEWIRSGADRCTVEALFEIGERHGTVRALLEEGGYADDSQVIIKRVIKANGPSRIYINGSLATARTVSEICYHLLNIASQHDHQQLLQPATHLDFLDTLGEHWPARERFGALYREWRTAERELSELLGREREREQRLDFLSFQINEIRDIAPAAGEDEVLVNERNRLKSAAALITMSRECYELLSTSVADNLTKIRKNMEHLRSLDPEVAELAEELSGYSFLAEDYTFRLREYHDGLEDDPARLDAVTARLDQLQGLKRKYGETLEDVLVHLARAEEELSGIETLESRIEQQKKRVRTLEQEVLAAARRLSEVRRETAADMEQAMAAEFGSLSLGRAGIEVRFLPVNDERDRLRESGVDRVEFFFAPNPGEPARPLAKVASGGELSRLMLALKCLLARKDMVDTVIFDEVDAGVGGEAAEAVARKIRELAGHHQVICITHLPQIAARGTEHFRVEKRIHNGRTVSSVLPLTEDERVDELARMLAGESASEQTEAWARELLEKGRKAA